MAAHKAEARQAAADGGRARAHDCAGASSESASTPRRRCAARCRRRRWSAPTIYIERLKEQEEAQKNAIEGAEGDRGAEARGGRCGAQALVKATQELKALEKHKEKFVEQWKKEMEAKEEEVMDELAQQIFLGTR